MDPSKMQKPTDVCLYITNVTSKAFQVTQTDDYSFNKAVWLPKSQVSLEQDAGRGDTVVFTMPEWLAVDKGLV